MCKVNSKDNVGYQLMKKMGWKSGCGLGLQQQGRVEPVPIVNKQDSGGIGRLEMELEQVREVSQHRRVLEVEKEDSEERRQKFKTHIDQEKFIAESTASLRQSYFCMDCNKQYSNYTEYDNHVNSYDHAHRQRFKNLRAQDFSRRMGLKRRKRDKATEEEAKRMNLIVAKERAEAAQKKKAGSGSGFRPVISSNETVNTSTRPVFKPIIGWEGVEGEAEDPVARLNDATPCVKSSHLVEKEDSRCTSNPVALRPRAPPAPLPPPGRTSFFPLPP
ncbi:G patch domain-containing protein 8-like isoform X2 [Corticium candelabrum]|uniref:G patch domain-containing protein 8-like isoform X2 n=1 Tax=Corticium candelabrum TaxID=121492 RepID=UPI002E25234E|nr:G patch domain-containing protein 8-like isoform X2 [Corticium candelabrum]